MTSPARPGEWVMVPKVATEKQLDAGVEASEKQRVSIIYDAMISARPAFTLTEEATSAAKDAQAFYVSSSDQGYFVRSLPQPGTIVSGPYESWWDAIDDSAKMNVRSAILAFLHHHRISVA